jgi:hypothetical protein
MSAATASESVIIPAPLSGFTRADKETFGRSRTRRQMWSASRRTPVAQPRSRVRKQRACLVCNRGRMSPADGVLSGMGSARFTYRVRVSAAAERALLRGWGLCRWVWNQCVAESKAASRERRPCGPAGLDKMLTGWREEHEWLREGSSVAQQQTVRDFRNSRAKALKDIRHKLPVRQRAGCRGSASGTRVGRR